MATEMYRYPEKRKNTLVIDKEAAERDLAGLSDKEMHKRLVLYFFIINGALIGTAAYVKLAPVIQQLLAQ